MSMTEGLWPGGLGQPTGPDPAPESRRPEPAQPAPGRPELPEGDDGWIRVEPASFPSPTTAAPRPAYVDPALETEGLSKTYATRRWRWFKLGNEPTPALREVSIKVNGSGRIHGLLGPNGSGKTTLMRAVLGLVRFESGSARILGVSVPARLKDVRGRIGAVVDQPRLNPKLTGRQNLRIVARLTGQPDTRVEETLAAVGLADAARRRVGTYSLGMRQRLALAGLLLAKPDLLFLDEPATGLDPAGRRGIRELMSGLAARGATVVLSSHVLEDVAQVCHSLTLLGGGEVRASGDLTDLLPSGQLKIRVDLADPDQARLAAAELPTGSVTTGPSEQSASIVVVGLGGADITRILSRSGIFPRQVVEQTATLEEIFLQLAGGQELEVDRLVLAHPTEDRPTEDRPTSKDISGRGDQ